ncbi:cyclase family protein [Novosphingobium flavum]|uniref:Cyclase family protein n=1 Tax=Novosphingobium flavum TaxID=1778672 RepID=A0A7X1FW37_9SPHN|nr:cyclase family protein [Novosphingobium flavum]MBC2667462.1 cyclase family protein [Novosphingobium flavum]
MSMAGPGSIARRGFLDILGGLAVAAQLEGVSGEARAAPVDSTVGVARFGGRSLQFTDLTHKLTRQFNFDPSNPRISMESVDGSGVAVGMKMHRLALIEHTGTHIDAPSHFGEQFKSLGEIPLSDLVVPLVVVDISAKAAKSRDAQVEPADVLAWERRHGRLPDGCCVAVHSGWDPFAEMARNQAAHSHNSTGFGIEAARMLAEKRRVKGIAVDAMTIDSGPNVPSYPVHQFWLRSGRWGIEGITNLRSVPPVGALLVVGAAPIAEATGLPVRAIALF